MKTFLFLLAASFLLSIESSFSQTDYEIGYLYYDAMFLALKKGTSNEKEIKIYNEIIDKYRLSIRKLSTRGPASISTLNVLTSEPNGSTNSSFSSLQSNLIIGTARFLAERTKEEINIAFFERMKDRIKEYPELQVIFPSTFSILNSIETHQYASIIQVLKDAFESDINTLQSNLYNLTALDATKYSGSTQTRIKGLNTYFTTPNGLVVNLALYALKEESNSPNFSVLLDNITNSQECKGLDASSDNNTKNISSLMKLTNVFSKSLLSKGTQNVWITKVQFDSLLGNKDALEYFLQALLIKIKDINFYTGSPASGKPISLDTANLKSLIKSFSSLMHSTNQTAKQIQNSIENIQTPSSLALINHFRTITNLAKVILKNNTTNSLLGISSDEGNSLLNLTESTIEPAFDILYHLHSKKYTSIVYDVNKLMTSLKTATKKDNFLSSFIKYGTLITSVASANSTEEVKQAIEASVLPVGSSSIKRNTSQSLTINSYVGIGGTIRRNENLRENIMYLYSPIGLTWTFALCDSNPDIGLHLNLFDLGGIVQHYLINGDESTLNQDVTFKDVFSPGLGVFYHIPRLPISVATNLNYIPSLNVPDLRRNNNGYWGQYFRWNVSILIDIPLFNLWIKE